MKNHKTSRRLTALLLTIFMVVTMFAGVTTTATSQDETVQSDVLTESSATGETAEGGIVSADEENSSEVSESVISPMMFAASNSTGYASEVNYCGQILNASTPYLVSWVVHGDGFKVEARADATLASGEAVLAQFDAATGTLAFKSGVTYTTEENGYAPDFAWNTYAVTLKHDDGNYYGIRANGDLTIDLGTYNNFIHQGWNEFFTGDLYGIYTEGNLTVRGEGSLKIPATFAQNLDEANGDADANEHNSYGIYTKGDVTLESGTLTIYSDTYQRWEIGSKANSTAVYADGSIYLSGTDVKLRYQSSVGSGNITHFSSQPVGLEKYTVNPVVDADLDSGTYNALGFVYKGTTANNNCFDYLAPVPVDGVSLNRAALTIKAGQQESLVATVTPDTATDKSVNWTSNNNGVATVVDGTVTAVAEGQATITATTADGGYVANCAVTVIAADANTGATEVTYCGNVLNADTPYLVSWVDHGNGLQIEARANNTLASGEAVLAQFDAETGTFAFKSGMTLTTEENGYEPDFAWNTYGVPAKRSDGNLYGIYANGDLTIDLGTYQNFIYQPWNELFVSDLYGIYAKGNVTVRGEGNLKLPATFAQNLDETSGDADANEHFSYGIYAEGNVYLESGMVTIYSDVYQRAEIGEKANSVGVFAEGKIYLNGTTVRLRYQSSVGMGTITHFGSEPIGLSSYTQKAITDADLDSGYTYNAIAFVYKGTTVNNNCFDYLPPVAATGVMLNKSSRALKVGASDTLIATVLPADATNTNVIWKSSNEKVATVSGGRVMAVASGQATITATTEDGGHVASCVVTVVSASANIYATEVVYGGVTLNEDNPYLVSWVEQGTSLLYRAQGSSVISGGESILAHFDVATGTLTFKSGMQLTADGNYYEPDFGWNTYVDPVQLEEGGDFYGIYANGDLTIDLGGYNNFIRGLFNGLFTNDLYGIYSEGDLTIKGDGYLKIPATLAQNLDATKGDNNAGVHYSYGIYAMGDVNLDGGIVTIFASTYQTDKIGSNANSVGIHAGGKINLNSTYLKFRYQTSVGSGKITHFSSEPVGLSNYTKTPVTNIDFDAGSMNSLGYPYIGTTVNGNCFDYSCPVAATRIVLDHKIRALAVNASVTLTATVKPLNASDRTVVWTSSNPAVATVKDGVVSGVGRGTATITATTADGNFSATCEVTVSDTISLLVDGVQKTLNHRIYVNESGIVFVPMVETLQHLGVTMTHQGNGIYKGNGKNGEVVINAPKGTAEVDWVDIELPAPVFYDDGTTMIPAYLIEDAVKTEPAVYDAAAGTLSVKSPDPNDSYYGGPDYAAIMKTLPSGTVLVNQSNLSSLGSRTYLTATKGLSVDGYSNVLQLQTLSKAYGEVPLIGDIDTSMSLSVSKDFVDADTAMVHFKARAVSTSKDDGTANLMVKYQRHSDWNKLFSAEFELDKTWRDYYIPVYARPSGQLLDSTWPAASSTLHFAVGGSPQTIQIANFEFIYYGQSVAVDTIVPDRGSYHGIEDDALWRKEAWNRIDKHRKDDASVTVVDGEGNPIEGATIKVKQTENDYVFGLAICQEEVLEIDLSTIMGQIRNEVLNNFNLGVCGLEMKATYTAVDGGGLGIEMANAFFERGMRLKGHALMWDNASMMAPVVGVDDYTTLSYEEIYRKSMDNMLPLVHMLKGKAMQWDVLNEPNNHNYIRNTYGTRLYTDLFNATHEIDPDAKLFVNETGTVGKNKGMQDILPNTLAIVKQMQDEGAHIDGIGLQTHADEYYYPMGLYHQLDDCAQLVDEVAVTEFDFFHTDMTNSGKYIRDCLLATFSHPKSSAFIVWGYWDTIHWRRFGLFYDREWNEKPAKAMWDQMVNEEFKTNLTLTTDENGKADFRGFQGDYEITIEYDGKERTFDFGILDEGENFINITVDGKITAEVSSGKYIEAPEPITYESVDDSVRDYRQEFEPPYISMLHDSHFRKGRNWSTASGISAISADDTAKGEGRIINNSANGTYSMSQSFSGTIYNNGNIELSSMIQTAASRTAGFEYDLCYATASSTIKMGTVATSASGYIFKTLGGQTVKLADNTNYDIIATLIYKGIPNSYDIKYTIKKHNKTVVAEITEKQTSVNHLTGLTGVTLRFNCNGAESGKVMMLKAVRAKFYTTEYVRSFDSAISQADLLKEDMLSFNVTDVVSDTSEEYLSGEKWGSNLSAPQSAFVYETWGKYLMGMRTEPMGEQLLKKKMLRPLEYGEVTEVEFDYYINGSYSWYSSPGYFDIRLESADGSISRSLVRHDYSNKTPAFWISFLADAAGNYQLVENVEWGDVSKHNKNNMHFLFRFTENASGGYDCVMTLTNESGVVTTATLANIFTKNELGQIDTFVIANNTTSKGTAYRSTIAGIKNIIVRKSGKDTTAPYILNDTMKGLTTGNIVAADSEAYLSGRDWGSSDTGLDGNFLYSSNTGYFFGRRTTPNGEKQIKKKLSSTLGDGDSLNVEFDYYINAPSVWFSTPGYFDVKLESADGSVSRSLVKHEYKNNDYGFRVSFLGDADGNYQGVEAVQWGTVSTYNMNNLHIKCVLTPNSSGGYDATLTVTNASNVTKTVSLANILTKEEALLIDTFVISNETMALSGVTPTDIDVLIAGIKNIKVSKTPQTAYAGGTLFFKEGEVGSIKYQNRTEMPFDVSIMLVRYVDDKFSSMSVFDFKDVDGASGRLSIPFSKQKPEENDFRLMVIDGKGGMYPLKATDNIIIYE